MRMNSGALSATSPHPAVLKLGPRLNNSFRQGINSAGSPASHLGLLGHPRRDSCFTDGSWSPRTPRWLQPGQHRPFFCRRNQTHSSNTAERDLGEIVEHGKNTEQQHNRMLSQKKKITHPCYSVILGCVRAQLAYLRQGDDNPPVLGSQGSWLGPVRAAAAGDRAKLE